MANFNPGFMIDVTRAATFPSAEFIGKCTSSTGIVSISTLKYGEISSLMVISPNGYDKMVIANRVSTEDGYIESWQAYRILAGVYGYVTNGVLTVESIWHGSLATLGTYKYLFNTDFASGTRSLTAVSVDENGLGTYSLSLSAGLNISPRKFIIQYLNTASQNIPDSTAFNGNQDLRYVDPVKSTLTEDEQEICISRIAKVAKSCYKSLYFPAGTFTGVTGLDDLDIYGNGSKGSDSVRTVIKNNYKNNLTVTPGFKSLNDVYIKGVRPGACKTIKKCYIQFPDKTAQFTGSISGTTLTVSTLTSGFIHIGATISGSGITNSVITSFISGTPGGVGSYVIDTSQEVSETTINSEIAINYFSSDTLTTEADYDITDNTWDLPPIYIPLYIVNPRFATIKRNKFLKRSGGSNSHTIRVDSHDASCEQIDITHNQLNMPTITGIFNGSNRLAVIKNLTIEWNEVAEVSEEAIAIDGFGNNTGLCPCICNGPIAAFSNDADGRLKVSLDRMIYNNGTTQAFSPVSLRELDITGYVVDDILTVTTSHAGYSAYKSTLKGEGVPDGTIITERLTLNGIGNTGAKYRLSRSFNLGSESSPVTIKMSDWKKFYFVFSENTGADGVISEIHDYDSTDNTLTLALFRPASDFKVNIDNWGGVHAGFFNGSVKHNKVNSDSKTGQNINNNYSTAISMYHNVFNFEVAYNTISGYSSGVGVTGGLMLSTYYVLSYGNSIHDNNIYVTGVNSNAVYVITQYTGIAQRGNRVFNNNIFGKNAVIKLIGAEDTICDNNTLNGEPCRIERSYPVPTQVEFLMNN